MKECPSCNSWLDDEVNQCHCGHTFPEGGVAGKETFEVDEEEMASLAEEQPEETALSEELSETAEPAEEEPPTEGFPGEKAAREKEEAGPTLKRCVMCREAIPFDSIRCRHCGSLVSLWEGSIFKEYFYFAFAALAIFLGCFLPWAYPEKMTTIPETGALEAALTGAPIIGYTTLTGVLTLFFSIIALSTSIYNIIAKRLFLLPILLAWLETLLVCFLWIFGVLQKPETQTFLQNLSPKWQEKVVQVAHLWGSGFYLVLLGTLIITFYLILSVGKAVTGKKEKKTYKPRSLPAGRRRR